MRSTRQSTSHTLDFERKQNSGDILGLQEISVTNIRLAAIALATVTEHQFTNLLSVCIISQFLEKEERHLGEMTLFRAHVQMPPCHVIAKRFYVASSLPTFAHRATADRRERRVKGQGTSPASDSAKSQDPPSAKLSSS